LGGIPCQAGVVKSCSGDIAVRKTLFLTPASSCAYDNNLLIAHALRCLQTVNPDITEMRGENLTTFGQPVAGDNEYQHATGFQPAIRLAQEHLLGASTVSGPQSLIVGRLY